MDDGTGPLPRESQNFNENVNWLQWTAGRNSDRGMESPSRIFNAEISYKTDKQHRNGAKNLISKGFSKLCSAFWSLLLVLSNMSFFIL